MDRFDLTGLRCQSERSRRDMEKSRGPAEVEPRFDAVIRNGDMDGKPLQSRTLRDQVKQLYNAGR
jgi:hypothetical protein